MRLEGRPVPTDASTPLAEPMTAPIGPGAGTGAGDATAYCGSPPVPGTLPASWNLDPWLLLGLALVGGLYALAVRTSRAGGPGRITGRDTAWFSAGWALVAVALVSPLCALTVALFAARAGQHMLLTLLAAPLLVLGRPERAVAALLRRVGWGRSSGRAASPGGWPLSPTAGALAFAVLLWIWHLPGPYGATLRSDGAYWAMHLSLFGAALLLWRMMMPLHRGGRAEALAAVAVGFLTSLQMSLLGAVITLAPTPWYAGHAATTWPWGLSPLTDQQLGGLILWVPGGGLFLAAGLAGLARVLAGTDPPNRTSTATPPLPSPRGPW